MSESGPPVRYLNRSPAAAGSLARGLRLLGCLGAAGRPLGLSELAAGAALDKATVHRLARTLCDAGYLTQDRLTRCYSLGLHVLDLGFAMLAGLDVRQLALPYMRSLATEFDRGAVSLSVLQDGEAVYVERFAQRRISVNVEVQVGSRIPTHCSSMGKAMLAALPVTESSALIRQRPLEVWTPKTITTVSRLEAELKRVRSLGYAVNDEETALGLRSVAAAVRDRAGRPAAALNIALSAAETSLESMVREVAPAVILAAVSISRHLGWVGPAPVAPDVPRRAGARAR